MVGSNGCKAVLTGNRGEYLRVVGIHSDSSIEREISLVITVFPTWPTWPNLRSPHFGDTRMRMSGVPPGRECSGTSRGPLF